MLKFFRKIRYDLLNKNKTGKYFKYAIGEIVLVVIGILIALQINNKNEQYKLNIKEQGLLKELHLDFKYNKLQIDSLTYTLNKATEANKNLLNLVLKIEEKGLDIYNLEPAIKDSISHYFEESGAYWTFNPKNGTVNAILNSSSLDIIKNDSLRRAIISWNDVFGDYLEDEKDYTKISDEYFVWTRHNNNFTEDNFSAQNIKVLFSHVNKNFLKDFQWSGSQVLKTLRREGVIDLVDTIIDLTEESIND